MAERHWPRCPVWPPRATDDCDALVDDADPDVDLATTTSWYPDRYSDQAMIGMSKKPMPSARWWCTVTMKLTPVRNQPRAVKNRPKASSRK